VARMPAAPRVRSQFVVIVIASSHDVSDDDLAETRKWQAVLVAQPSLAYLLLSRRY
jgi:hypothetical protein